MKRSRLKSDPAKLRAWRERSKGLQRGGRLNKVGIKILPPKVVVDGVIVYGDGRERCDKSKAGRVTYHARTIEMLRRQDYRCAWCGKFLPESEATFDHENGRTSGHIDERIWKPEGLPQNAALHGHCNCERGSTRAPYKFQSTRERGRA